MRLGLVSLHTSPLDSPGSKDAGGMNVVEVHQATALADRGHQVELVTRRDNPDLPELTTIHPGVVVRHLDAGPAEPRPRARRRSGSRTSPPRWAGCSPTTCCTPSTG